MMAGFTTLTPGSHMVKQLRRIPASGGLMLAAFFLSMILAACSNSSSGPSLARANAPQSLPVTVAPVVKQDLPIYLNGLGSAEAYYTVSVKSRVDGQLVDVKFKEGEFVKQGQILAVIDPRPYQVQLDQAQAQLFKDQATLRDAQLNYQRYKDLLQNSGAMSQQQVDTQKATVDQLDGTVRNDQAAVENAKLNLTYCHITAPVSGRIGLRLVDPGNMVHASDTNPMLVITQLQPITVVFTLPEDQLPEVAQHMRKGPLAVDAYSRDDQTKLASGKLLTIDNQIDQTTGTGRLKAVFTNEESVLWPNQFVNVHLLLETQKNATVIPSVAVQTGPNGNYVYVVKSDKTVENRAVNVSLTQGLVSDIASGLSSNELVVTDGQDKLQPGSHVEPHAQAGGSQGAQNASNPMSTPPGPASPNVAGQGNNRQGNTSGPTRNRQPRTGQPGTQNTGTASR
jgi:multidrug efflux system membrane fusion protein